MSARRLGADLPAGWSGISIRRLFRVVGGATPRSDQAAYWDSGSVPWFTPADLSRASNLTVETSARQITPEGLASCSAELLPAGSVLVSCRAPIGYVAVTSTDAATNQGCKALVGDRVDPRFVAYQLSVATEDLIALGQGTTFAELSGESLADFSIAIPWPLRDATSIADFLDRETAKIDALIAKQKQLIATLQEDRIATITLAVTRGMNASVAAVGESWPGEVPPHWVVGKVKYYFDVVLGKMYQGEQMRQGDAFLPHLKAGNLTSNGLMMEDPMFCWFSPAEVVELNLRRGDVLVVEGGSIGRCVVLDQDLPGWGFQKSLNRVRPRYRDLPEFLAYVLEAATASGYVSLLCGKATIPHFTAEKLGAMEYPRPPVDEQRAIVDFLTERDVQISLLSEQATNVIDRLCEYRSALITDAVTGKIDVREMV
ncbi:restriction endonuclease subunit S [Gordonia sp. GONU]|uniref:restriction endonuclease subunit S n=1 Tax=Gordonia sp. GONU TaxID=2972949 RepID=UPI0021AC5DF3|nr:restriction endonuclease subunit S [Gordonia sp. GONU]MCR8896800.1 restriction endonuclease subunit S [Gordonia sp. GONU]